MIALTTIYHHVQLQWLQSKLGASPVSPLGVVADGVASAHPDHGHNVRKYLHCQTTTDLIHWGMGRFCFIFLASFCLIRKVFRADMIGLVLLEKIFHNLAIKIFHHKIIFVLQEGSCWLQLTFAKDVLSPAVDDQIVSCQVQTAQEIVSPWHQDYHQCFQHVLDSHSENSNTKNINWISIKAI